MCETLERNSIDVDCDVIEGSQREAILYACGANSEHGIQRNNDDKRNAVRTILENPLVAFDENGAPWNDRAIGRICNVDGKVVARQRPRVSAAQPQIGKRAVSRGGTTYTMDTVAKWRSAGAAEAILGTPKMVYLVGAIPSCFMRSRIAAISGARGWNIRR